MASITLLERSDFDCSGLGAGQQQVIPIRQALDVSDYASGTLLLRAHALQLPAGASVQLELRVVAPTPEDPGQFFRGPLVAVAELLPNMVAPSLAVGPALLRAGAVGAFLRVRQGGSGGVFTFTVSAVLEGQRACSGWSPLDLGGKLRLWLDQRDQVAVSGAVSEWGDQSPANNDFDQNVSAGRRPLTGARINDLPAPSFDGTDDYMELVGGATLSSLVSSKAYHVFVVARFDTITLNNANPYDNHVLFGDISAAWTLVVGTPGIQAMHWDAANQATPATPVLTKLAYLIEWSFDGSTIRCRVGPSPVQSVAAGDIVSVANATRLGVGNAASGFLSGRIASVICCNKYLSDAEAQNARAYLSSVYGVPS